MQDRSQDVGAMGRAVNLVGEVWDWFALGMLLLGVPLGGAPRVWGRRSGPSSDEYAPPTTVQVAPGDPPEPSWRIARPPGAVPAEAGTPTQRSR